MLEDYFKPLVELGVLGSALRNERGDSSGKFEINTVLISNYSPKGFKGVDDAPFGGGAGMIMRADVLKNTLLEGVVAVGGYDASKIAEQLHIVCPAPRGTVWCHAEAKRFAQESLSFDQDKDIVFICGRYEGIDERFLENYVDEYISMGDFILTGGELAVMTILDSAMRFHPGVLGNKLSAEVESFSSESGQLEYALYTRPRELEDKSVPEELISGSHKRIAEFQERSSNDMTKKYRPDLLSDN